MANKNVRLRSLVKSKGKAKPKSKSKPHKPAMKKPGLGAVPPPGLMAALMGGGAPGAGAPLPPPMGAPAPMGAPMGAPPMGAGAPPMGGAPTPPPMGALPPPGAPPKPMMPPPGMGGPRMAKAQGNMMGSSFAGQGGPVCTCSIGNSMSSSGFRGQGGPASGRSDAEGSLDDAPISHTANSGGKGGPMMGNGGTANLTSPAQCAVHAAMVHSPFRGETTDMSMYDNGYRGQGGPEQDMGKSGIGQNSQLLNSGMPVPMEGMGGPGDMTAMHKKKVEDANMTQAFGPDAPQMEGTTGTVMDGHGGPTSHDFLSGIAHGIAAGGLLGNMFQNLGNIFNPASSGWGPNQIAQAGEKALQGMTGGTVKGVTSMLKGRMKTKQADPMRAMQRMQKMAPMQNSMPFPRMQTSLPTLQQQAGTGMQGGSPRVGAQLFGQSDVTNPQEQVLGFGAMQPNQANFGSMTKPSFMAPLQPRMQ